MHEMSIAVGIVNIATKSCQEAEKSAVTEIGLEIGELAGIEMDALEFIWPLAVEGTVLEHAKRVIKKTRGEAICLECAHVFPLENHHDVCPKCNSYFKKITKGKELKVNYLEV
jgi:hydrogenase nickel incorporation protein HypA/HybF